MKKYQTAVVIGRFQPVHKGHLELFRYASTLAEDVLICIGSANAPRTPRNPWTYEERREMISRHLDPWAHNFFFPIDDNLYEDDQWISQIRYRTGDLTRGRKVCLVGFEKDATSYYLRYFPDWKLEGPPGLAGYDATSIREAFFKSYQFQTGFLNAIGPDALFGEVPGLPDNSAVWEPKYQDALIATYDEWDFNKGYDPKKYPVFVNTVDAVVVSNGHVLVVRRKHRPGQGLLALPGGHVNPNERLFNACIRELREETSLDLSNRVLSNALVKYEIFDHPQRSERARVITTAYLFHLRDWAELPGLMAGDDAAEAFWIPFSELRKQNFFEDHYDIIQRMIGGL